MKRTERESTPARGTIEVAQLSAAFSAQHLSPGVKTGMLLYKITGTGLSGTVNLTLPNTAGYKPGSVLDLMTMNPVTGGHDVAGELVVSADGKTMTSTGPDHALGDWRRRTTGRRQRSRRTAVARAARVARVIPAARVQAPSELLVAHDQTGVATPDSRVSRLRAARLPGRVSRPRGGTPGMAGGQPAAPA